MDIFQQALTFILRWEGGYADHPADPGGATNMGVTQASYDAWRRSEGLEPRPVRLLTREEAEVIYHQRYWVPVGAPHLPPALALVLFDAAVNHGLGRALNWKATTSDWRTVIAMRLQFYASLTTFPTFGRGWTRRMADLQGTAASLEAGDQKGKVLLVFDENNDEIFRRAYSGDVIVRSREDRVYVRLER